MNQAAENIYFNPWDPAFRANPYPHYRPLLAGPPRILDLFGPIGMVTRYADVTAVLRDYAHFLASGRLIRMRSRTRGRLRARGRCSFPIRRCIRG